jgi:glycosyltransferase involved in cell wall biosynthesis
MRVVAIVQAYNARRFVAPCIEHLRMQGVDVYLIDDASTDGTADIAERYLGQGVVGIQRLGPHEVHDWQAICRRKEELAANLDADWLIHHDIDEFRVTGKRRQTLVQALEAADAAGYNAVNFLEFTFVPTREAPDHDHPQFTRTMRSYYAFAPGFPHRLNAFKRQDGPVELAWSGGHRVRFPGLAMAPRSLFMRHYLYLSAAHAIEKYVHHRPFAAHTIALGWHGFRRKLRPEMLELPPAATLRRYRGDTRLDPSHPRTAHLLEDRVAAREAVQAATISAAPA